MTATRRPHVMTPARRAALRKAQLASAAKRRGHGKTLAPQPHSPSKQSSQARVKSARRRRAAVALGAVAAGGALAYSQAHSPRSYTRTAMARQNYRRQYAATHTAALQNVAAQVNRNRIQKGKALAPFDFRAVHRQTRESARVMAAANFPKGAIHKPKNVMRLEKAKVRASRISRTPRRARRR